ncbi:SRPBCC family protein [Kribbella sp. CA-247076]|uniref:SRPBCC family protein n=1 Tax=Kribbella sp. CA-247076 TaxID=3239941 RepID=UPI003D902A11
MFTLTQVIEAPPSEVARAFTEPEAFAAWFVAEGFRTPSDRVTVDARPGGLISAVFVGPDGAEVPFSVRFGEIDLPRSVVLHVDDPEVVTVRLEEVDGRTHLEYESRGVPADHESTLKAGVETMLERMAAYYA